MQGNFSDVMTIYNHFTRQDGEGWKRTVIYGVELADRRGEAVRHSGAASSSARRVGPVSVSEMTVLIPNGAQAGYLPPMGWRTTENREGRWTLQAGDIIVPGSCDCEIAESIAELIALCERVAVISTVTDFGGSGDMSGACDMCHWEVTAR